MSAAAPTTIFVTRPRPDADALCEMLAANGHDAVAYPALAIAPPADVAALAAAMARVDEYRVVVFVSPNAIRRALAVRSGAWPRETAIGVMGPGSVAALAAAGIASPHASVIAPSSEADDDGGRFDSEALFAALDDAVDVADAASGGARALIVRGDGGRGWLAKTLREAGVAVDEVEAYRRTRGAPDRAATDALRRAHASARSAVFVVTSSEGLGFLDALVAASLDGVASASDASSWLRTTTIVAPHRRIAEKARALGFSAVRLCAPGDRGVLAAIE